MPVALLYWHVPVAPSALLRPPVAASPKPERSESSDNTALLAARALFRTSARPSALCHTKAVKPQLAT